VPSPFLLFHRSLSREGTRVKMDGVCRDFGGKIPLSRGEQHGIPISNDETVDLRAQGAKYLVGRFGIDKKFNKEAFKALLLRVWHIDG
jgi:hypothetical protein